MIATAALLTLICILISLLYLRSKWKYDYWKKRNVPHAKPTPILGNYADYILLKKYYGLVTQDICKLFPQEPYLGTYFGTDPALIIQDPELIRLIMSKDFVHFHGREITSYSDKEVVTQNLFFAHGDRWKACRQNMSPAFSSGKLKNMFPLIQKCADTFKEMLDREFKTNDVLEAGHLMKRYMMDCICSCGFGIDVKTMDANVEDNQFAKIGNLIFENSNIRGFLLLARSIWPKLFYGIGLRAFPREIEYFFQNILIDVFKSRHYKPSGRNDFVDMMLNMKGNLEFYSDITGQKVDLLIDDDFLVAQCVVFFAAGYETSATTLSHLLFELAKDQEKQDKVIKEMDEYLSKHDGKINYDCVSELPYLSAAEDETLRLYPVLGTLTREVMKDYILPDGMKLEKGLRIHLPVYHLHHNPDYFPDPEEFRPERFLPENKKDIIPYTYMPFGEGPRMCIGMRLVKMQSFPALLTIFSKYRVHLAEGTPQALDIDPRVIVAQSRVGIYLKFTQREK